MTHPSPDRAELPERIRLSRKKGWRLPPDTVVVARPTRWGNPYTILEFGLDLSLELYRRSLTGIWSPAGIPDRLIDSAYAKHTAFRKRFKSLEEVWNLRGARLACWCPLDQRCHADILLEVANRG